MIFTKPIHDFCYLVCSLTEEEKGQICKDCSGNTVAIMHMSGILLNKFSLYRLPGWLGPGS